MKRILRVQLRTIDITAARAFYTPLFGENVVDIVPLPKQAAARGAPAHWLGYIGVDDVDEIVHSFVQRGASPLGDIHSTPDGHRMAVLRDPGGATIAVSTNTAPAAEPVTVWYQLHAANTESAIASYRDLFGWSFTVSRHEGAEDPGHEFAWHAGGPICGSVVDVAGLRGVHSHWLFHFRVPVLESALASVRAQGGVVVGPTQLPGGDWAAMCEDPQRGAFMLRETSPRGR